MSSQQIRFEPTDTFFFRDGKPFSRGEQSEATGIFPPFPSTVYGALRTLYISEHGWRAFEDKKLKEVIGTTKPESIADATFRLKGVFLSEPNGDICYPTPRDCVAENSEARLQILSMSSSKDLFSNSSLKNFVKYDGDKKIEYPEKTFVDEITLEEYLHSLQNPTFFIKEHDFLVKEPKIGIGRNATTHRADEGLLYSVDMMSFKKKYCLKAEMSGISFQNAKGLLKVGGENKAFGYKIEDGRSSLKSGDFRKKLAKKLEQTRKNGCICFKLYFATPVIWEDGWNCRNSVSKRVSCELITAAIGKYQSIGGWDIANRRPKKMYRAVPAASVYFLKASESTSGQDIVRALHYKNISDQRKEEGFGLAFVGTVTEDI